jgi:integrase
MARKRTGTVQKFTTVDGKVGYRARISLDDGKRVWVKVPEAFCYSEERAREFAAARSEKAQGKALESLTLTPAPAGETCDAWFDRYGDEKRARGQTSVDGEAYRWSKWVSPAIGSKPVAAVTKDDVENVRDALDLAIARGRVNFREKDTLSPKTAANIWGVLVSAFAQAANSKRRDLRLLAGKPNPCEGVLPPDRGAKKAKAYPYPQDLLAVLACDAVPYDWKELHVLAAYTYLRPGELRALLVSDLDFDGGRISVVKAWDGVAKKVKPTKTGETRSVPIEPALLPLLKAIHARQDGQGLVAPLMGEVNEDKMALALRRHLRTAGVTRPALFAHSATELPVRFRSWREAGLTWRAIRGDDHLRIMQGAGHKNFTTTQIYIREAENVSIPPGSVFPALPASLLVRAAQSSTESSFGSRGIRQSSAISRRYNSCEGGDLNPYASYGASTSS